MIIDKIKNRMEDPKYKQLNITTSDDSEPYVFISYKSDDWPVALTTIVYELQTRYGLRVYFDRDFDEKNALWTEEFQKAMGSPKCKAVLVFLSKNYCASYATLMELMYSQTKICMVNRVRKPLVPIIIDSNFQNDLDSLLSNEEDTGLRLEGAERLLFDRCFDQLCIIASKEPGLDGEVLNSYVKQMRLEKRICAQLIEEIISFSKTNYNLFIDNNEFYQKLALTINDAVNSTKNSLQDDISVFTHLFEKDSQEITKYQEAAPTPQELRVIEAIDQHLEEVKRDVTFLIPEYELNQLDATETYNRGYNYWYGRGVDIHYSKAFAFFVVAASRGIKDAWFHIGYAYDTGSGVAKNQLKASYWYLKSSEIENDRYAQFNLGLFYEFGRGVSKNFDTAVEFYEKSASQHHITAMYRLGRMYKNGYGNNKTQEEAFNLLLEAAKGRCEDAYIVVAREYDKGEMIAQDYSLAFHWYELAATLENSEAEYQLGYHYELGLGIEKDLVRAGIHYKKSAEANNTQAKERIEYLAKQSALALKDKVVATSSTLAKKAAEVDVEATKAAAKEAMKDVKGKFSKLFK